MRSPKIAAAGDIHASVDHASAARESFEPRRWTPTCPARGRPDDDGEPEQAEVLADAARPSTSRSSRCSATTTTTRARDELAATLGDAGVHVLDRESRVCEVDGDRARHRRDEGLRRRLPRLVAAGLRRAAAARALRRDDRGGRGDRQRAAAVVALPIRIVLLHYAPTSTRSKASPRHPHVPRQRPPCDADRRVRPDLVLHGHAHAGSFEGRDRRRPVYNVAVHVTRRDF